MNYTMQDLIEIMSFYNELQTSGIKQILKMMRI